MASAPNTSVVIRQVYRELVAIAKERNPSKGGKNDVLQEIRMKFRRALSEGETVEQRLKEAQDRLSFLRISSVKVINRSRRSSGDGEATVGGRWVYRNGERLENTSGTLRDATGRVVSPYDGKNLDPQSVTRHRKSLKRAGFINNSHAKGIF